MSGWVSVDFQFGKINVYFNEIGGVVYLRAFNRINHDDDDDGDDDDDDDGGGDDDVIAAADDDHNGHRGRRPKMNKYF